MVTKLGCEEYLCRVTYWTWFGGCSNSISTGAQYITLDNKIKCLRLATNKTVIGTAYTWGLLIANYLDQSLWSTNQKYWVVVRSNLLRSFLEVHHCVAPFTRHGKLQEFGAEKPISWAKPAHFDFLRINFTVWSHILTTCGDPPTKGATCSSPR